MDARGDGNTHERPGSRAWPEPWAALRCGARSRQRQHCDPPTFPDDGGARPRALYDTYRTGYRKTCLSEQTYDAKRLYPQDDTTAQQSPIQILHLREIKDYEGALTY